MAVGSNHVFDDALSLPAEERLALVERLLESLNSPIDPEIERLWAEEAERRIEQFDRGEVEAIPAEKVFADLRARFAR